MRPAINDDWVALASRSTSDPEKRKALRDHLDMSTCALRAVTEKLKALSDKQRGQGVEVNLEKLAIEIILPAALAELN